MFSLSFEEYVEVVAHHRTMPLHLPLPLQFKHPHHSSLQLQLLLHHSLHDLQSDPSQFRLLRQYSLLLQFEHYCKILVVTDLFVREFLLILFYCTTKLLQLGFVYLHCFL